MTTALETKGLEKQFGGLKVTRDLSLQIEQGARHALIGPNGECTMRRASRNNTNSTMRE